MPSSARGYARCCSPRAVRAITASATVSPAPMRRGGSGRPYGHQHQHQRGQELQQVNMPSPRRCRSGRTSASHGHHHRRSIWLPEVLAMRTRDG
jgi:hypothetical protein